MISINPNSIPPELINYAKKLVKTHKKAEIYLVGGAVRDIILKRETKDFDLVIKGITNQKLETWLKKFGKVNFVGKNFGVFKWQPRGWVYETIDIALPRTEKTINGTGQYRDFKIVCDYQLNIKEDLKRRDLTINALALNLITWQLIDPSEGLEDLQDEIINTVGDAEIRFSEDLSRPLRALRLACQLGFEFEPYTFDAIKKMAEKTSLGKINNQWLVPRETIAKEFLKSLYANPSRTLMLFNETGFLIKLFPEVAALKNCPQPPEFHKEGDVFNHTKLALNSWQTNIWKKQFGDTKPSANVIIAVLLHDIGKPLTLTLPKNKTDRLRTNDHNNVGAILASKLINRLKLTSYLDPKFGTADAKKIVWLIKNHMLLVHGQPANMKPNTIYKYFLQDKILGQELLQVIFMDISASLSNSKQEPNFNKFDELINCINQVTKTIPTGKFKTLLTGTQIIKQLKIKPGPKIGELLDALQTNQLNNKITTKQEAIIFIKQYVRHNNH